MSAPNSVQNRCVTGPFRDRQYSKYEKIKKKKKNIGLIPSILVQSKLRYLIANARENESTQVQ